MVVKRLVCWLFGHRWAEWVSFIALDETGVGPFTVGQRCRRCGHVRWDDEEAT